MKTLLKILLCGALAFASAPAHAASFISNLRVRADNTPVHDGRVFIVPSPMAFAFDKPAKTLWSGTLTRNGKVIVDRENPKGWATPEFSCGTLSAGPYELNIRLLGNPTKTIRFSVEKNSPPPPPAPCITLPLVDVHARENQTVTFTAAAGCAPQFTIHWEKDGEDIGFSGNTLTIASASLDDEGTYTFIARAPDGAEATTSAELVVSPLPPPPPTVVAPAAVTVLEGEPIEIKASVNGEHDSVFWTTSGGLRIAEDETLSVDEASPAHNDTFHCIARGPGGEGRASTRVTVLSPAKFTLKPIDQGALAGASVTFTAQASGTAPLRFQWYRATETGVLAIPSATGNQLTLPKVSPADAGAYQVKVSNAWGADEAEAELTVILRPYFISPPEDKTVAAGGALTVSVSAGGTPPIDFIWIKPDGTPVHGATEESLELKNIGTESNGRWKVVARGPTGETADAFFNVKVVPPKQIEWTPGAFTGLFYSPDEVAHESSGAVNLTLAQSGAFTGFLRIGARKFSFSGSFDASGRASVSASALGAPAAQLSLELELNLDNENQLTGAIAGAGWNAELTADRAVFSKTNRPCPWAGSFTLALPADETIQDAPAGDGYAVFSIDLDGAVSLSGKLADGTSFTMKTMISNEGVIPFYAHLYSGKGSAIGWINLAHDELDGLVSWIKPSGATPGFATEINAIGSRFDKTAPLFSTAAAQGVLILSGSDLEEPITVPFRMTAGNKAVTAVKGLRLTLRANGSFDGAAPHPKTGRSIPFHGCFIQSREAGFGYFVLNKNTGFVYVGEAPEEPDHQDETGD